MELILGYFAICGTIGISLWLKMMKIMKSHGHAGSFLIRPKELIEFSKIIKKESDPILKRKYRFIFWGQIVLIPIYFGGMIFLIKNLNL